MIMGEVITDISAECHDYNEKDGIRLLNLSITAFVISLECY